MAEKKYDSVEQALVEGLGAVVQGSYEKLGEFLIADGEEDYEELVDQALDWLKEKFLLPRGFRLTTTDIKEAISGASGTDIRVYAKATWSEYRFMVLPDRTPAPKHYHFVEVSVLVPPRDVA